MDIMLCVLTTKQILHRQIECRTHNWRACCTTKKRQLFGKNRFFELKISIENQLVAKLNI